MAKEKDDKLITEEQKESLISLEIAQKFDEKIQKIPEGKRIALIMHIDPDPDSIAPAMTIADYAQKKYGIESNIFGTGHISHPMNKTMCNKMLIDIKDKSFFEENKDSFGLIIFCDTPKENASIKADPDIIIDHHIESEIPKNCLIINRKVGATSTLIYLLMEILEFEISEELATALLIGINTDTKDLTKQDEVTEHDQEVHKELLHLCNYPLFAHISHRYEMPRAFLRSMGLVDDECFNNDSVAVIGLGEITKGQKDICAIMADLTFRDPGTRLVVIIAIEDGEYIRASVRNSLEIVQIDDFCKKVFENKTATDTGQSSAGARFGSGGAKIPLSNREREMWEIADEKGRKMLFDLYLKRFRKRIQEELEK